MKSEEIPYILMALAAVLIPVFLYTLGVLRMAKRKQRNEKIMNDLIKQSRKFS